MDGTLPNKIALSDDGTSSPKFVVGIGASAGGLEALERLFHRMPDDTGMAFVVGPTSVARRRQLDGRVVDSADSPAGSHR